MKHEFSQKTLNWCRDFWIKYLLERDTSLDEKSLRELSMDDLEVKFDACVNQHVSPDIFIDPLVVTMESDPAISFARHIIYPSTKYEKDVIKNKT